tara:strand:+ start:853 stop:1290 length:438 start_codon:yes stop_codon:yes gene_type:complete
MKVKVFIENEANSNQKNIYNEKTLEYKKTVTVSRKYPYAYGFIPNTTSGDGDNVDCFVLTNHKFKTGDIIEVKVVGLMEQLEDGEVDHNILAVPVGETTTIDNEVKDKITDFINHVFDHLPNKTVTTGSFLGKKEAVKMIKQFQD